MNMGQFSYPPASSREDRFKVLFTEPIVLKKRVSYLLEAKVCGSLFCHCPQCRRLTLHCFCVLPTLTTIYSVAESQTGITLGKVHSFIFSFK